MDNLNTSDIRLNNSYNSNTIDDIYFDNPFDVLGIRVVFFFCYILVFLLCITGNAMVLFAIIRSPRLRSMTNFLLANLAVADFCVGVFCVLPNLSTFLQPNWILGKAMCKIYYYIWNVSYIASIIILTVVAMERYIAILHPLKARHFMTNSRLVLVQIVIWLIALLYNIPFLVFYDTISFSEINKEFCYASFEHVNSLKWLSLANVIVWYLIPLILIGCIYYRVAKALWKTTVISAMRLQPYPDAEEVSLRTYSTRTILSNQESMSNGSCTDKNGRLPSSEESGGSADKAMITFKGNHALTLVCGFRRKREDSPQEKKCFFPIVPTTPSSDEQQSDIVFKSTQTNAHTETSTSSYGTSFRQSRYREIYLSSSRRVAKARRKVIRLLMCVVVTFGVCVLPHMMKVLNHYWMIFDLPHFANTILSPISFIVLYLNSVLNPFLYAIFSTNFRKSFKETLSFCRLKRTETRKVK